MLVECRHCEAIIHNDCRSCPWCDQPRERIDDGKRKGQFGLLGFFLVMSIFGIWLGYALQDSMR